MSAAPSSNDSNSQPRSVYALLQSRAVKHPNLPAISSVSSPPLSYQGLLAQVNRTVSTLNRHGIGRGDRVALVLPNGPDLAVAFLAVAAGATCAPLNAAYRAGGVRVLPLGSEYESAHRRKGRRVTGN